ncbi:MAG: rhomboid family intramembrane serine protease, partial [Candidatus Aenigmarchaeota archaeon]|nr:rhomboid family intramembrane serine protease [Candidatus Aenigmarchaeota archaeon]
KPYIISEFGLALENLKTKPYTLITHMFLHTNLIHLIINMLIFLALGIILESKIGSLNLAFFYFFSGFFALPFLFLIQILTNQFILAVGSSACIFGLIFLAGAIAGWEEVPVLLVPLLNILALPFIFLTLKNFKVPFFVAALFYILLDLILLWYYFPNSMSEFANFGGIIGGIIAFILLSKK